MGPVLAGCGFPSAIPSFPLCPVSRGCTSGWVHLVRGVWVTRTLIRVDNKFKLKQYLTRYERSAKPKDYQRSWLGVPELQVHLRGTEQQ
jgi:hypothetical protein